MDTKRKEFYFALAVFFIALACRGIVLYQMHDSLLFRSPMLDAAYYDQWAQSIAAGDWKGGTGVYPMSPGYPYLLAVFYKLFGRQILFVAVIQIFFSAFSCVLVFWIARRWLRLWASALAGLLLAFCGTSIFYATMLLKAVWIEGFNALLLLSLLRSLERPSLLWPALGGLALGISSQFRPNVLLLLPVIVLLLARPQSRRKSLAAFFLSLGLLLFPVALRNKLVGGSWVLSTSHGGMNFYTGNNPVSAAPYRPLPFARSDPQFEQDDFHKEAERLSGRTLSRPESSRFWVQQTWRFIADHPGAWAKLLGKKFLLLWNVYEQPINQNFYFFSDQFSALRFFSKIGFNIFVTLGFLGLAAMLYRKQALELALYLITYAAGLLIFFVVSEYRHPMIIALSVFAAGGGSFLFRLLVGSARNIKKAALAVGAMVLLTFLTRCPSSEALGAKDDLAVAYNNLGSVSMEQNDFENAVKALERSIAIDAAYADPHYNLGETYVNAGQPQKGIFYLEKAMALKPGFVPGHYEAKLGLAYAQTQNYVQAKKHLEKALSFEPNDPSTLHNYTLLLKILESRKRS